VLLEARNRRALISKWAYFLDAHWKHSSAYYLDSLSAGLFVPSRIIIMDEL